MSFFSPSQKNTAPALPEVELGPDLEWLLLNDQAETRALAIALASEFGKDLLEVLHVFYSDPDQVEVAAAQALAHAVAAGSRFRAGLVVLAWFFFHAFDNL